MTTVEMVERRAREMSEVRKERTGAVEFGIDDDGDILIWHPLFGEDAVSLAPENAYELGVGLVRIARIALGLSGKGLQA